MKRIFAIIALVAMGMFVMAQTNQLVWANGQLIYGTPIGSIDSLTYGEMEDVDTLYLLYSTSIGSIDSLTYGKMEDVDTLYLLLPRTIIKVVHDTIYIETPENSEIPGMENGHEYVDLGLPSGLKWATCNVGATTPEEYGDYFAWGEVESKEVYDWSTYKYCAGTNTTMTKYCNKSSFGNNGFTDNKTELDPEDDAAAVNWGGAWRMPTADEFDELRYSCTWEWTTQNGVKGYKVTGPNGNSIFLPTVGCMREGTLCDAGSYGYYLSSSLEVLYPDYAYGERFDSGNVYWKLSSRCFGQSVRPVCWLAGDKE